MDHRHQKKASFFLLSLGDTMVESLNKTVDFATKGTSFHGLTTYGKIMVGDKAFEFYNDKNIKDYIQIPWEEIEFVAASVVMKGKYIPRFSIETRAAGTFSFAAQEPHKLLRAVRAHVGADKMLKSLSFMDVLKRGIVKKKKL